MQADSGSDRDEELSSEDEGDSGDFEEDSDERKAAERGARDGRAAGCQRYRPWGLAKLQVRQISPIFHLAIHAWQSCELRSAANAT